MQKGHDGPCEVEPPSCVCQAIYLPVCGRDNQTYPNQCEMDCRYCVVCVCVCAVQCDVCVCATRHGEREREREREIVLVVERDGGKRERERESRLFSW